MSTNALVRNGDNTPSMLDNFFRPLNEWFDSNIFLGKTLTVPQVNILDEKDEYKVSLAAPGMKKEDFNIDISGNMITISSEKEENKEQKDKSYTRKEYNYSSFSRSFTLPENVNKEKIEAHYENGLLKLSLPKKDEARKAIASKHIIVK